MNKKPKYQWILHHVRSTDRVFFGPFENYKEIDDLYNTIPLSERIHCHVELLINPFVASYDEWWYDDAEKIKSENPELFYREGEVVEQV